MQGEPERVESDAVEVIGAETSGAVLVLCEHASCHIPARYNGLGLSPSARESHAAWDPGARAVACHMARALDAPLVAATVSRLVYDCNRPPDSAGAMTERSELIEVPGNRGLSASERAERVARVYTPFCAAVSAVIAARRQAGVPTALVTVHSFSPDWFGKPRDCEIGILHDADTRLADAMLAEAGRLPHRIIRRNDPYGPGDGVTHSLRLHGIANGLPNVMIEIRNDLLRGDAAQECLAGEVLDLLRPALARCGLTDAGGADA